eukprot:8162095-Pyramimonas_sp.AAC.1
MHTRTEEGAGQKEGGPARKSPRLYSSVLDALSRRRQNLMSGRPDMGHGRFHAPSSVVSN